MALKKCSFCEKVFNDVGTGLCSQCMNEVDKAFIKVRKFIYQNPDSADFSSIIENTEVPERELNYLVNLGRIQISDRPVGGEKCIICGVKTSGSSICFKCKNDLSPEKAQVKKPEQNARVNKINPLSYNQRKL